MNSRHAVSLRVAQHPVEYIYRYFARNMAVFSAPDNSPVAQLLNAVMASRLPFSFQPKDRLALM